MAEYNPPCGGRRKALKTIGAGMMAMAGPMIGSTAARSNKSVVISIQRGQGNGIDAAEYDKLLSRFTRIAKKKAGLEELAVAEPELSDGENIYSLVFIANPGGGAQTYIGSGTYPEVAEIQRLHDRAAQFQKQTTTQSIDDDLSTQATDPDLEWGDPIGSAFWDKTDYPYGIVQSSPKVWRYSGDPNYDVYAATVDAVFAPGSDEWNDSYYDWTSASVRQYWGRNYDPGEAKLTDWTPEDNRYGDTEVSSTIGYSGASVTVTYNPPSVERTDNTSTLNDNVRIVWEPGDTVTEEVDHSPSVASIMQSENYASVGDTLLDTDCRFDVDNFTNAETLTTPLALTYEE